MRIRVLSDLHLEFKDWIPPRVDADVVVLAGDVHVGVKGVEWARRSFPSIPIVYISGNHEFYGEDIHDMTQEMVMEGSRLGVDVLDGRSTVISGVRFLGATLWTDFALGGTDPSAIDRAMADAQYGMYDFQVIRCGDNRKFRPTDARAIHLAQVRWLRSQLTEQFVGTTVVVTHHLPHPRSIHRKYKASDLNPSFASDLSNLMGPSVSLWIHGHTHESFDYVVNSTRVVCNPRGYAPMELNEAFDPVFTVDARATSSSDGGVDE
jgi:predicted phosphodiesterase